MKTKTPKAPRKCIDCGRIQDKNRCRECAAFVKAFTPNKYGEYA